MKKILFIIFKKIKTHKKKSTFLLILTLVYYSSKKGYLKKLLQKIMNLGITILKNKIKSQNDRNQKKLKKIKKNQIFIKIYKKVLQNSASEFGEFVNKNFNTEILTNKISEKKTKKEKLKVFKDLNKLIMKKIVFSLLAQFFFDFKNFYLLVIFFNNYKALYNKDIDLEDSEIEKILENDFFVNKNENFVFFENFINDFIFKIMKDFLILCEKSIFLNLKKKFFGKFDLKSEICLQEFTSILKEEIDLFLSSEEQNIPKINLNPNFKNDNKTIKLEKKKKNLFFIIKKYIYTNKTKKEKSPFTNYLKNLESLSLQTPQKENQKFPLKKNFNNFLNLLTSNYFYNTIKIFSEFNILKFMNRLGIIYKKKFSESLIYEKKAKIKLAIIFSNSKKILDEEFFDSSIIKISQNNLKKRIKLALFILKKNDKLDQDEKNKIKDEDLNCTIVNAIDPFDQAKQLTSFIFLEELNLYDSYVFVLKYLAEQILE